MIRSGLLAGPAALALILSLAFSAWAGNTAPLLDKAGLERLVGLTARAEAGVTVVNYWATWCGPCRQEIPDLMRLRQSYTPSEMHLVGISLDFDPGALDRFLARHPFNYPIFFGGEELMNDMGVGSIPRTVVYDSAGRVRATYDGPISLSGLKADVDELLKEDPGAHGE